MVAQTALTKLTVLKYNWWNKTLTLKGLHDYIHWNQALYCQLWKNDAQANKTYTSQVAESHIDSLINARHKEMEKMQWSREDAITWN